MFGIATSVPNQNIISSLTDLSVDSVQIPLHLTSPSPNFLDSLISANIKIIGKYVPPRSSSQTSSSFYKKLFQEYPQITIWDFGGEPETRSHQPGCRWSGSAEGFVDELRCFYEAGKEVSPFNSIGAGGFISGTFNGFFGNEDRSYFLKRMFGSGALDFMDFCSMNLYCYGYGGRKNLLAGILKMKSLIAEFGKPEMDLAVAETGVPCSGDPKFLHIIKTEEEQAISLVKNTISNIGLVSYWIWFCLLFQGWGILKPGTLEPRKAFYAYKKMIRLLKNAKFVGQLKVFPEPERWLTDLFEWYKFETPDKEIHVVFLEHEKIRKKFPPGAVALDIYGKEIIGSTLLFSEQPIYLITSKGASPEEFLRN